MPSTVKSALAAVLCLSSACARDAHFLDSSELQALILVHVDGPDIEATAYALNPSVAIEREAPAQGTLYALGYAESLDALRLPAGALQRDEERGGPLPSGERLYALDDDGWQRPDARPRALESLRVSATSRCGSFEMANHPVATVERVRFATAVDARTVLVATSSGTFYRVTADGPIRDTTLSTTTPHAAAYRASDGTLWLAGADRRVVSGTLDAGFVERPSIPLPDALSLTLSGAGEGADFELFASNDSLAVAHFDGRAWTRVREPSSIVPLAGPPRIVWYEPGWSVLVGAGTSSIAEVGRSGVVREVFLDAPLRTEPNTLYTAVFVEGVGPLLVTRYTSMFLRADERWLPLPAPSVTPRPAIVLDLGDRTALVGGQNGILLQWRSDHVFCDPLMVGPGSGLDGAARLGNGFVAVANVSGGLAFTVATRR